MQQDIERKMNELEIEARRAAEGEIYYEPSEVVTFAPPIVHRKDVIVTETRYLNPEYIEEEPIKIVEE